MLLAIQAPHTRSAPEQERASEAGCLLPSSSPHSEKIILTAFCVDGFDVQMEN